MSAIYIASFLLSLLLSLVLTRLVRNQAIARGWIASPAFVHHIHNKPVPRLGGVAIFISFAIVLGLTTAGCSFLGYSLGFSRWTLFYLAASGMAIFLLGVYDDVRSASPYIKLAIQGLAATWLYFEGFRIMHLPLLFGEREFGWIGLPLTIFWMLLITNAFNLIDGLDGLASGSALFSTLTVFAIALINNVPLVALLTVILAGAIMGFLRFNFNPATIFLGDCGSLFIGFMLGALALAGSYKTPTVVAVAIPVVSFGLPIFETIISVLRRFLGGQPLFSGDREHIHHKLLEKGLSHRQAVIILYGVSAIFGLLSLLLLYPGTAPLGVVLLVIGVGIWIAVQHLGYHEFFEIKRVAHRTIEQKKIFANNVAIRRAAAQIKKADSFEWMCQVLRDGFEKNDFDGFRIALIYPYDTPTWKDTPSMSEQDQAFYYEWQKDSSDVDEKPHSWSMTLDIMSMERQRIGYINIFRHYSDQALLVDINILISEFNAALTEAVRRILERVERQSKQAHLKIPAAPAKFVADLGTNVIE